MKLFKTSNMEIVHYCQLFAAILNKPILIWMWSTEHIIETAFRKFYYYFVTLCILLHLIKFIS